ncbi:hypothetical protein BJV82DRAFT_661905 [Fennellomyces sp. T-0311]|nr:hypothetical protein BJV82DRAFT_661905 [Fennellomyces sp. T-0311]
MSSGFGRLFRSKRSSRRLPDELPPNALEPGRSYLLKVSSARAHICIFQGHDEGTNILRWPEARYLGGDFHAYAAFDEHYNPHAEFWYELGTNDYQPIEWFIMFDEAYRKECEAVARQEPPPQQEHSIQLPYLTRNNETPQSIKEENNAHNHHSVTLDRASHPSVNFL